MSEQWCIPPKANAEFVCKMEDVLDVYKHFILQLRTHDENDKELYSMKLGLED
ncbi:unnamed protein product [marine sediment metagenome]|uniref:Uncharacterized protein n=1 Tax=marine sediment metagenome TaxID=412755 RepID=X0ZTJ5_9ZZZZ